MITGPVLPKEIDQGRVKQINKARENKGQAPVTPPPLLIVLGLHLQTSNGTQKRPALWEGTNQGMRGSGGSHNHRKKCCSVATGGLSALGGLRVEGVGSLFSHLALKTGTQTCRSLERVLGLQGLIRSTLHGAASATAGPSRHCMTLDQKVSTMHHPSEKHPPL